MVRRLGKGKTKELSNVVLEVIEKWVEGVKRKGWNWER